MSSHNEQITRCSECPMGSVSHARGEMCPLIARERSAGETLFVEGEPAAYAWFVKRGTVTLRRESGEDRGEGPVRAVRFPGSFVGLEALVTDTYIDSARAVTDVTLCGAPRDALDQWLGPKGTPLRTALEVVLKTECQDVVRQASPNGSAAQRVARWLETEGEEGATLSLPRRVAADLLGMRAETLSRALAQLTKLGAITTTRTEIHILNAAALRDAALG